MKLNLGSSNYPQEGYINVDINPDMHPDVVHDVEQPLPFEPESVDEIRAMHLLEHLRPKNVGKIVENWASVLKTGGKLVIEVPDMDGIATHWEWENGRERLLQYIFGDQSDEFNHHYWGYNKDSLDTLLTKAGFDVEFEEPQSTDDERHLVLRAVGTKL